MEDTSLPTNAPECRCGSPLEADGSCARCATPAPVPDPSPVLDAIALAARAAAGQTWKVRTRYGWGWAVENGTGGELHPIESAILADEIAKRLNAGMNFGDAIKDAGGRLDLSSGRIYLQVTGVRVWSGR